MRSTGGVTRKLGPVRRWGRVSLALLAGWMLAGCVTLDADFRLHDDRTVDYQARLTLDLAALDLEASPDPDLCDNLSWWFSGDPKAEPITSDGVLGCRVRGTASIGDLADSEIGRRGLEVTHQEGHLDFSWKLTGADLSDQISEFEVSVTFPGEVVEHNGSSTVAWNTVTWRDPADLFQPAGLVARGRDRLDPRVTVLLVAGMLGLAGLVVGSVAVGLKRHRSRRPELPEQWPPPDPESKVLPADTDLAPERGAPEPLPPEAWAPGPEDDRQVIVVADHHVEPSPPPPPRASPWAPPDPEAPTWDR